MGVCPGVLVLGRKQVKEGGRPAVALHGVGSVRGNGCYLFTPHLEPCLERAAGRLQDPACGV